MGFPCPGCAKPASRRKSAVPARRKSWEQDDSLDGLGLPDEDFDYEDFVAREFGAVPHRRLRVKLRWWLSGVVLLGILIYLWVFRR